MAELVLIQMTKCADGGSKLRCVRDDGSATWQSQTGPHALFFPLHDLLHYAVETALQAGDGFYGLIARGWDIAETTGKTSRGPIPPAAITIEHLVGMLDLERASLTAASVEELNHFAREFAVSRQLPCARELTDKQLEGIRVKFRELSTRWQQLPADGVLELSFALPEDQ